MLKRLWDWLVWEVYKIEVEVMGWIGTWFIGWHPVVIILFGVIIVGVLCLCFASVVILWRQL